MQPVALELGYICNLLHRANAGSLHVPDGVSEVVDDDVPGDFEESPVRDSGDAASTEPGEIFSANKMLLVL